MVATARVDQERTSGRQRSLYRTMCYPRSWKPADVSVRSDVDFVITFEELTGMFEAKGILLDEIQAMDDHGMMQPQPDVDTVLQAV